MADYATKLEAGCWLRQAQAASSPAASSPAASSPAASSPAASSPAASSLAELVEASEDTVPPTVFTLAA